MKTPYVAIQSICRRCQSTGIKQPDEPQFFIAADSFRHDMRWRYPERPLAEVVIGE
jgi:hypothetical protein